MIAREKYKNAVYAIHLILVRARFMAYKGEPYEDIANILDYAEILPRYLISDEDETNSFLRNLEGLSEQYPFCSHILEQFKSSVIPKQW